MDHHIVRPISKGKCKQLMSIQAITKKSKQETGSAASFKIRSFIAANGERFSQIYRQGESFPVFYPTAFIARSIRSKTTHETQKTYLEAIKRICEWEATKFDLMRRFQEKDFLHVSEVDDLANYLRHSRTKKSGITISPAKGNSYILYAAQYLSWLANEVITDPNSPATQEAIQLQYARLKETARSRTGSVHASAQLTISKCLPEHTRKTLVSLWSDPLRSFYRPVNKSTYIRTRLMLRILYETGMRRGELLSLKLGNFLESGGGSCAKLVIERNHHDEHDTRLNQPVAKTRGRIVPISNELEDQLQEYITLYRAEIPNVGFSDNDFIFVTHRAGRRQGEPLSISTFDEVLKNLRRLIPELIPLHPHLLRHDWNYRFSQLADEKSLDQAKEAELRAILMGWSETSDTARVYNRRHTQEQALQYGLAVAEHTKLAD